MAVPFPTPALIASLRSLTGLATVGDRISTALYPEEDPLPAIRVTLSSHKEAPTSWEATPVFQLDVWAEEEIEAGNLAWAIRNEWPSVEKVIIGDALVTARWVEVEPIPFSILQSSPNPQFYSGIPRYLLSVGLRLSGVN